MIKSIEFTDKALAGVGLKTKRLADLGPLVVLAGPNGGGKTRYLRLVHDALAWSTHPVASIEWLGGRKSRGGVFIDVDGRTSIEDPRAITTFEAARRLERYPIVRAEMTAAELRLAAEAAAGERGARSARSLTRQYAQLVRELLGSKIEGTYNEDTNTIDPLLDGRFVRRGETSNGQSLLLALATIFNREGQHIAGNVLFFDEPEQSLHPDACWRAISRLRDTLGPDGQLWIATHSVPLIAQIGVDSLYYVENGEISRAVGTSSRVWRGLLGDDDNRDRLIEFLDGDAAVAAERFATECLLGPGVVDHRTGDPQSAQFVPHVAVALRARRPIRVLEYRSGRGRLVGALVDVLRADSSLNPKFLTYVTLQDPRFENKDDSARCKQHLAALGMLGAKQHYLSSFGYLHARDARKVNLVVLANVLHEIPVEDWLELFNNMRRASADDATLLVIEDQEPRIGELPHPRGFLILEHNEWCALTNCEIKTHTHEWNHRRLTAFEIPIQKLRNAQKRIAHTLDMVARRSIAKIKELRRASDESHRTGRRHAFYAMLHMNATLARQVYEG